MLLMFKINHIAIFKHIFFDGDKALFLKFGLQSEGRDEQSLNM